MSLDQDIGHLYDDSFFGDECTKLDKQEQEKTKGVNRLEDAKLKQVCNHLDHAKTVTSKSLSYDIKTVKRDLHNIKAVTPTISTSFQQYYKELIPSENKINFPPVIQKGRIRCKSLPVLADMSPRSKHRHHSIQEPLYKHRGYLSQNIDQNVYETTSNIKIYGSNNNATIDWQKAGKIAYFQKPFEDTSTMGSFEARNNITQDFFTVKRQPSMNVHVVSTTDCEYQIPQHDGNLLKSSTKNNQRKVSYISKSLQNLYDKKAVRRSKLKQTPLISPTSEEKLRRAEIILKTQENGNKLKKSKNEDFLEYEMPVLEKGSGCLDEGYLADSKTQRSLDEAQGFNIVGSLSFPSLTNVRISGNSSDVNMDSRIISSLLN